MVIHAAYAEIGNVTGNVTDNDTKSNMISVNFQRFCN